VFFFSGHDSRQVDSGDSNLVPYDRDTATGLAGPEQRSFRIDEARAAGHVPDRDGRPGHEQWQA
jgi:hypothetical protein